MDYDNTKVPTPTVLHLDNRTQAFDLLVVVEDQGGLRDEAAVEIIVRAASRVKTTTPPTSSDAPIVWTLPRGEERRTSLPIVALDAEKGEHIQFTIAQGNTDGYFVLKTVNATAVSTFH